MRKIGLVAGIWMLSVGCSSSCQVDGLATEGQATVFDFIKQFPFVEYTESTRRINFGSREARPHLMDGWSRLDQVWEGGPSFVCGAGEQSSLRFQVSEPARSTLVLRARPFAPNPDSPDRIVTVGVNGTRVGDFRLERDFKEYRVQLPATALVAGENVLTFQYSVDPPTADPFPADENPRLLTVAWDRLRIERPRHVEPRVTPDESPSTLFAPLLTRLDYFTRLPEGTVLRFDGVASVAELGSGGDFILRVEFQVADSEAVVQHFLRTGEGGQNTDIPIPSSSGNPVRISFTALPGDSRLGGVAGIELQRPRLVATTGSRSLDRDATAAQHDPASSANLPAPSARVERPDVVLYLIDALRADRLGVHGYAKRVSPRIDAFAEDGVVFLRAQAQSAWTRSAVASLFTGLYPRSHGVLGRQDALPESAKTLASLLHAAGYETVGFSTNGNVSEGFGFDVGFDAYTNLPEQQTDEIHQLSDRLNEVAVEWLEARASDNPLFLYLHSTDPHEPYTPRSPFRERFAARVGTPRFTRPLHAARALARGEELDRASLNRDFIDLYDAEVAFNDNQFGRFVTSLRELGLYDEAMVILVADHGEEFLDHGGLGHGATLYAEQLDIPLIIKLPRSWGAGTRSAALALQIDILPTVLAYLGVPVPSEVQGRSLLPLVTSPQSRVHPWAIAQLEIEDLRLDSLTTDELKLIRSLPSENQAYVIELYDRLVDSGEQIDLSRARPVTAGYLLYFLKVASVQQERLLAARSGTPDEELLERLRALGYIR